MIALTTDHEARVGTAPVQDAETILGRVRAIIHRRRVPALARLICEAPGCTTCEPVKAKPFACITCGSHDRPLTFACDCPKNVLQQMEWDRATLHRYPTIASWPADWRTPRPVMVREARALRLFVAANPVGLCAGEGAGHPTALTDLVTLEGNCCHGITICSVCGAYGDGGESEDDRMVGYLLGMLRDLREVLDQGVAAPDVLAALRDGVSDHRAPGVAADPHGTRTLRLPGDLLPWMLVGVTEGGQGARKVRAAVGSQGAGPVVVVDVIECEGLAPGERDEWVDLEISIPGGGHESLSAHVTDETLERLILALTTARDDARAKGIIPAPPR